MRVWIDIANAPHVRFFAPVVERLRADGDDVLLTVRAHRETAVLAREIWPDAVPDSGSSPNGRVGKGAAILARVVRLATRAHAFRPDVALSHNSYAQIIAARALHVPAVTAMDYEHQPANHLAFRLARLVVVPDAFPDAELRQAGARQSRVRRYEGLKEQLYLDTTSPRADEATRLGVVPGSKLAVVRLPPDGALYHRNGNSLVHHAIAGLRSDGYTVVALARSTEQRTEWRELANDTLVIPDPPVDTRSLLLQADVVVGAGGTMTREAAVLGVPTVSIFSGEEAAVDRWLEQRGRLTFVRDPADASRVASLAPAAAPPLVPEGDRAPLDVLLRAIRDVSRV